MKKSKAIETRNAAEPTRLLRRALDPGTLDEALKLCERLASSKIVPKEYQGRPDDILVAVGLGQEIGLSAMQAIQSIAVINGRPCLWGDAMLGVVRASGLLESIAETYEGAGDECAAVCVVKRRGEEPREQRFTVAMAKAAGLWTKSGPWTNYRQRMLRLRARSWALRDVFPDILRGLGSAEEQADAYVATGEVAAPITEADYGLMPKRLEAAGGAISPQSDPDTTDRPAPAPPEAKTTPSDGNGGADHPPDAPAHDPASTADPVPSPNTATAAEPTLPLACEPIALTVLTFGVSKPVNGRKCWRIKCVNGAGKIAMLRTTEPITFAAAKNALLEKRLLVVEIEPGSDVIADARLGGPIPAAKEA